MPLVLIPPANTPFYICVTGSAAVAAARSYLASNKVSVILVSVATFSTPLVILIKSTTLLAAESVYPPAKTAYYIFVTGSVIVVATRSHLASDKVPVIRLVASVVPLSSVFNTPLVILIASIVATD